MESGHSDPAHTVSAAPADNTYTVKLAEYLPFSFFFNLEKKYSHHCHEDHLNLLSDPSLVHILTMQSVNLGGRLTTLGCIKFTNYFFLLIVFNEGLN